MELLIQCALIFAAAYCGAWLGSAASRRGRPESRPDLHLKGPES